MVKKRIALLFGGPGAEREVSIASARCVERYLKKMGYEVIEIDFLPQKIFTQISQAKPDIVFNCLHGTYGEDGAVQGVLENLAIPYTHSNMRSSAIAINKKLVKLIAAQEGIRTPKFQMMSADQYFSFQNAKEKPLLLTKSHVIKPNFQGSTVGVFLILTNSEKKPSRSDWHYGNELMVEEYIEGQEISSAVVFDQARGLLELCPQDGFYNYQAKYTPGVTKHIMPANIPNNIYHQAMEVAEKIHHIIGCRTISRSDFRYNAKDGLNFLEINTHPGFTDLSILPEIAAFVGISFEEIIQGLLKDAKCDLVEELLAKDF